MRRSAIHLAALLALLLSASGAVNAEEPTTQPEAPPAEGAPAPMAPGLVAKKVNARAR